MIFNAFNQCPWPNVKVVLIGQDPYHEPGQAHGLKGVVANKLCLTCSLQTIGSDSLEHSVKNDS